MKVVKYSGRYTARVYYYHALEYWKGEIRIGSNIYSDLIFQTHGDFGVVVKLIDDKLDRYADADSFLRNIIPPEGWTKQE